MHRWFLLSAYHWTGLFALLSASALVLAWISFGLINLAMANAGFLAQHGLMALREGGLVQLAELVLKGFVALLAYLVFKAAEVEMIYRWRKSDD